MVDRVANASCAQEERGMLGAIVAALVVGFLAGLLSFKVKSRWCTRCGAPTVPLAAGASRFRR
jgi:NADH pyrophosphatase NudC (nudix superfamily)